VCVCGLDDGLLTGGVSVEHEKTDENPHADTHTHMHTHYVPVVHMMRMKHPRWSI